MKNLLVVLLFLGISSFGFAGAEKDTMYFEAGDAIRYAKFIDFYKFGEDWDAKLDTTGKYWIVTASKMYTSHKVIKGAQETEYFDKEKGCLVESFRILTMDRRTGKVVKRRKYVKINRNN
jgi:hypothetical protein